MTSRPYLAWKCEQLEALVEESPENQSVLEMVSRELAYRSSQSARTLRSRVDQLRRDSKGALAASPAETPPQAYSSVGDGGPAAAFEQSSDDEVEDIDDSEWTVDDIPDPSDSVLPVESNHAEPTDAIAVAFQARLERLRNRLLDLTNRNALIDCRSARKKWIEIVDEIPTLVVESLEEGKKLFFEALPEPEDHTSDGDLFSSAELTDGSDSAADGTQSAKRTRRGVRSRPRKDHWDRVAAAQAAGVEHALDLRAVADSEVGAHRNNRLQTLLFPDELDRDLDRLREKARTVEQELGTNPLHVFAGIIEWVESGPTVTASDAMPRRQAPLVVVPVQIERRANAPARHHTRYQIARGGDEIATNVSFFEKCKQQFQLELPALEPREQLESYFRRVEVVLADLAPAWRLRRQLMVGTASFGRIRMWIDLGAKALKAGSLRARKTVTSLIIPDAGESVWPDASDADYGVAPFGRPPEVRSVADQNFVLDADGTQRRVLQAVAAGQSMVVEGPPGTGKSQTIVNTIAQSVAEGKSVLFVAQKETALSVVFDRLRATGLEHITLPLFSKHATTRQSLARVLAERLREHRTLAGSRTSQETALDEETRLNVMADALREPWGPLQLAPYQLIGRAERAALACDRGLLESLTAEATLDATKLDQELLQRLKRLASDISQAEAAVVRVVPTPAMHPWCGVTRRIEIARDQDSIIDSARSWRQALEQLHPLADELEETLKAERRLSPSKLEAIAAVVRLFSGEDGETNRRAAMLLEGESGFNVEEVRRGMTRMEAAWTLRLPSWWSWARPEPNQLEAAEKANQYLIERLGEETSWGDLLRCLHSLTTFLDALSVALPEMQRAWAQLTGTAVPLTSGDLPAVLQLFKATDPSDDSQTDALAIATVDGHPSFVEDAQQEQLRDWKDRVTAIAPERGSLRGRFDLNALPSHRELRQHVEAIRRAASIAPAHFSSAFRRARVLHQASGGSRGTQRSVMADELEALSELLCVLDEFSRAPSRKPPAHLATDRLEQLDRASRVGEWASAVIRASPDAERSIVKQCLRQLLQVDADPTVAVWGAALPARSLTDAIDVLRSLVASQENNELFLRLLNDRQLPAVSLADELRPLGDAIEALQSLLGNAVRDEMALLVDIRAVWRSISAAIEEEERSPRAARATTALTGELPGPSTDWMSVKRRISEIESLRRSAAPAELWAATLNESSGAAFVDMLVSRLANLTDALMHERSTRVQFEQAALPRWSLWFRHSDAGPAEEIDPQHVPVAVAVKRASDVASSEHDLLAWDFLWRGIAELEKVGLDACASRIIQGRLTADSIVHTVEALAYRVASHHLLREHMLVRSFDGASFEQLRRQFAQKDVERLKHRGLKIRKLLAAASVPGGPIAARKSQLRDGRLIEHQGKLRKRHRPIREVTSRTASAIRVLTPCVLSTPEGVAQYLPPDALRFDLVVIDEASQMRPEVALGSLMRGAQAVIVGDSQQLGPESLFEAERMSADEDESYDEDGDEVVVRPDGETIIEGAESILTAAATLWPKDSLGWHYRSQTDELIAFSNRWYYDNRLVVFPSAGTDDGRGVVSHRIDGIYQSGANARVNVQEAEHVVELVRDHARERPAQSLMVVTFNAPQRDLIMDKIREAERDDEVLQRYSEEWDRLETPFVVRNLVNVQGDERDRVIISTTFGRAPGGVVAQNFGDISRSEGARRINVLVTRARFRIDVVTSMDPEDIRTTEKSSEGVHRFQAYLRYARGERWWAQEGALLDRDFDSPFEEAVYESLRRRGYDVEKQVGVSTYRVDLAIRHPDHPGRFLLGIECDGATYHSSAEARDRDRLREEHLRKLGWDLHRVWSTDWFRRPELELERAERAIQSRLAGAGVSPVIKRKI